MKYRTAYRCVPFPMTLSDREDQLAVVSLFKCNSTNTLFCATFPVQLTARRMVSTTAELLVSTDLYISIAWGLSKCWSKNGLEVTDPLFTFVSIWSAVRPCS